MRVVVIGGTGHFGGRICHRLAQDPNIELIAPGRTDLDIRSAEFRSSLIKFQPDVVVHTAGPFQQQEYAVAQACIDTGCHYVDLADGREFVAGFSSLNAAARAAGVTLISGASTLPGVSSSVIEAVRSRFSQILRVETSIAPAHQTPRGIATVSAVLSYCGKSFTSLRNGSWQTVHGWQDLRFQRYPGLGSRLSGACNVPDLELMPANIPGLKTATFHAALEAFWEQGLLWLMAWLSRLNFVADWTRFSKSFSSISDRTLGLGSDRGGMHIRVAGVGHDDKELCIDWYLMAASNHGPEIPCTPSIVMTKKLIQGEFNEHGAFACWNLFTIDELLSELVDFNISVYEKESVA